MTECQFCLFNNRHVFWFATFVVINDPGRLHDLNTSGWFLVSVRVSCLWEIGNSETWTGTVFLSFLFFPGHHWSGVTLGFNAKLIWCEGGNPWDDIFMIGFNTFWQTRNLTAGLLGWDDVLMSFRESTERETMGNQWKWRLIWFLLWTHDHNLTTTTSARYLVEYTRYCTWTLWYQTRVGSRVISHCPPAMSITNF